MDKEKIPRENGFSFQFDSSKCWTCRGACCRGLAGYIWLNMEEMAEIADMRSMAVQAFCKQYIRRANGKLSLREHVVNGEYFCCFFDPIDRRCNIYEKRPEQCRTFPFWNQFKNDPSKLEHECPGVIFNRMNENS